MLGSKDDQHSENGSEDEENVSNLCEEASMPIEQVIEKYQTGINPNVKKLQGEMPNSPFLRARRSENQAGCSGVSSSSSHCDTTAESSHVSSSNSAEPVMNHVGDGDGPSPGPTTTSDCHNVATTGDCHSVTAAGDGHSATTTGDCHSVGAAGDGHSATTTGDDTPAPDSSEAVEKEGQGDEVARKTELNGELPVTTKTDNVSSSTTTQENGEIADSSPKGKGLYFMIISTLLLIFDFHTLTKT